LKYLPEDIETPYRFHKMFRQGNVTPSAYLDVVIWHLIGSSKLFWNFFKEDFDDWDEWI
jgi:hypothetical protein